MKLVSWTSWVAVTTPTKREKRKLEETHPEWIPLANGIPRVFWGSLVVDSALYILSWMLTGPRSTAPFILWAHSSGYSSIILQASLDSLPSDYPPSLATRVFLHITLNSSSRSCWTSAYLYH